jgi:hypothetical protein
MRRLDAACQRDLARPDSGPARVGSVGVGDIASRSGGRASAGALVDLRPYQRGLTYFTGRLGDSKLVVFGRQKHQTKKLYGAEAAGRGFHNGSNQPMRTIRNPFGNQFGNRPSTASLSLQSPSQHG